MATISVVISAWNEEKKLGRTLDSVSWADERIVVDNESSDGTAKIARSHGAAVFSKPNDLMLNRNKNYGFSKAKGDWILNLDADEVVTPALAAEIRKAVGQSPHQPEFFGYWIRRKNILFGRWIRHGLWWPDKQLRLFRRGKGAFPCGHIHEYVAVDGPVSELQEPMEHYNYENIDQYMTKLMRCTTSEAESLMAGEYQFRPTDAIRFPITDFVKIYFSQRGYRDGLHGLVLALLQAFYSFVVFAKVWELQRFREHDTPLGTVGMELRKSGKEVWYWFLTAVIENAHGFRKIAHKAYRRIIRP